MERRNIHRNIKALFDGSYEYVVPLYQRNFAWGEPEITQLLQDLYDGYRKRSPYFVGSLVVLKRDKGTVERLEVIDGQQRLTVVTLILKTLGESYFPHLKETRLFYDSREEVSDFLETLGSEVRSNGEENYNGEEEGSPTESFRVAVETIMNAPLDAAGNRETLAILQEENEEELHSFAEYIVNNVYFVLAEMPGDTDVATYFEIMNNSGDQLKKHEILKARILNKARETSTLNEMKSLAAVWDACSQMDIMVQKSIAAGKRSMLFGEGFDAVIPENVSRMFDDGGEVSSSPKTLMEIVNGGMLYNEKIEKLNSQKTRKEEEDSGKEGEAIIDFPNFLMHIFRRCYSEDFRRLTNGEAEVPLNEKDLLKVYHILEDVIDPKTFMAQILYYRVIFDRYIVRSVADSGADGARWVLRRPNRYSNKNTLWYGNTFGESNGDNEEEFEIHTSKEGRALTEGNVIKALSLLQVSFQQRLYKNFLAEILSWFEFGDKVRYSSDWFLPRLNNLILKYLDNEIRDGGEDFYVSGTKTSRFVLNTIDYLMYLSEGIDDFDFRYLNTIEHHLPQSRIESGEKYGREVIDSIGNLFPLSRRDNSTLNDRDPLTKAVKAGDKISSFPPNRRLIYERTLKSRKWGKKEIDFHSGEIMDLFGKRRDLLGRVSLNEGLLLYRACLSIDNYCREDGWSGGGIRYCFSDLNPERAKRVRKVVEKWKAENLNDSIECFIQRRIENDKCLDENSWRRVFVKYPSVTEYCREGCFAFINQGIIIYLLPQRQMVLAARELRSHILYERMRAEFEVSVDRNGLWFDLTKSEPFSSYEKARVWLHVWIGEDGRRWLYEICYEGNGNSKGNRILKKYGWIKNEGQRLYIEGRPKLCSCSMDYEESIDKGCREIKKMLKQIKSYR